MTYENREWPGVLTTEATLHRLAALAQAKGAMRTDACEILFVCVPNAGRPQTAAALTPAGLSLGEVRAIRAGIDTRVREGLAELQPATTPA